MSKKIISGVMIALSPFIFSCEQTEKTRSVKDVFASFPLEEIKNVMPALTDDERNQLLQNGKSANWKAEVLDETNNRIEIVPVSINEGTFYSKIIFVTYYKSDGGVFVSLTATPATQAQDFRALFFEGAPLNDKATWQWANYELYSFLMKDFLAENVLTEYAEVKVLPYLDVFLLKDTIRCAINDFIFFMNVQQNLTENSEYNEAFENTYLKYHYDFIWVDGKFVKQKLIRKGYDNLCAETAHEVEENPNGPPIGEFDCGHAFLVKASSELATQGTNNYLVKNVLDDDDNTVWSSSGNGVGQWIEFTYTTGDYPFAGQSFHIKNGYVKNEKLWKANSRVKKMRIEIDGKAICRVTLLDTDKFQSFIIQKQEVSKQGTRVRFVIEEIYKGEKYEDTVISCFIPQGNCG